MNYTSFHFIIRKPFGSNLDSKCQEEQLKTTRGDGRFAFHLLNPVSAGISGCWIPCNQSMVSRYRWFLPVCLMFSALSLSARLLP